jgi:glutathione S-transferase
VDGLLADRRWLLGAARTVADAYLYAVGRWARYHEVADLDADYPHLAAWFRRMELDPGVQFALAIERGEAPAGNGACLGHVALDALRERLAA